MLIYAIFLCSTVTCLQVPIVHTLPQGGASPYFVSKTECEHTMRETGGPESAGWRCLGRRVETWQ